MWCNNCSWFSFVFNVLVLSQIGWISANRGHNQMAKRESFDCDACFYCSALYARWLMMSNHTFASRIKSYVTQFCIQTNAAGTFFNKEPYRNWFCFLETNQNSSRNRWKFKWFSVCLFIITKIYFLPFFFIYNYKK